MTRTRTQTDRQTDKDRERVRDRDRERNRQRKALHLHYLWIDPVSSIRTHCVSPVKADDRMLTALSTSESSCRKSY